MLWFAFREMPRLTIKLKATANKRTKERTSIACDGLCLFSILQDEKHLSFMLTEYDRLANNQMR